MIIWNHSGKFSIIGVNKKNQLTDNKRIFLCEWNCTFHKVMVWIRWQKATQIHLQKTCTFQVFCILTLCKEEIPANNTQIQSSVCLFTVCAWEVQKEGWVGVRDYIRSCWEQQGSSLSISWMHGYIYIIPMIIFNIYQTCIHQIQMKSQGNF